MIHVACRMNDHHTLMITQAGRDRSPDIKDKAMYELSELSGIVIVQSFCKIARTAEYGWPGMDTCCIDENSNTELQESIKIQLRVHVHLVPSLNACHRLPMRCSCFIPARRAGEERVESIHKEPPEIIDDVMDIDAQ